MTPAGRFVDAKRTRSACHATALLAHANGFCVLPPREDGSKRPLGKWRARQRTGTTLAEISEWFMGRRSGVGLLTGAISNGGEIFEFDDAAAYQKFKAEAPPEIAKLGEEIESGYLEHTPSGGVHWLYRCSAISGNLKLASRPKTPEEMKHPKDHAKTLIETRGEGGFVVIAPSHGKVHPSAKPYTLLRGSLETVRTITPEERASLHAYARTFDRMPKKPETPTRQRQTHGQRPSEEFDLRASWGQILEPHGWEALYEKDRITHWQRPGKGVGGVPEGTSATTNHGGRDRLHVFSSSTCFDQGESYTKFAAHVVLNYGGDWERAVLAAREHVKPTGTPMPKATPTVESVLVPVRSKRPRLAGSDALRDAYASVRAFLPAPDVTYSGKKHRLVKVYAPGWSALSNALHCCQAHELTACKEHGAAGCKAKVCRYKTACEFCSTNEANAVVREILENETWKEREVVLWTISLADTVGPDDHLAELDRLARRMRKCVPKNYARRMVKSVDSVTILLDTGMRTQAVRVWDDSLLKFRETGTERYDSGEIETIRDRAAGRGLATTGESAFRTVLLREAVEHVRVALRSPNVAFMAMIDAKEYEAASKFPWLTQRVVRTSANKAGKGMFPWPSAKGMRERARAAMVEERHGVDLYQCAEPVAVVEGKLTRCCLPYDVHLASARTGHDLAPPRSGRGFQFHEAAHALDTDELASIPLASTTRRRDAEL